MRRRTMLRGLLPFWRQYRWIAVLVLALFAAVLGYVGLSDTADGAQRSWTDNLYRTVGLFFFSGGVPDKAGTPWQLEVSRVLAPVITSYAGLRAAVALFRERLRRSWVTLAYRDHVVVCGLGLQGGVLAAKLQAAGERVVGIEADPDAQGVARCRQLEIPIFAGDATDRTLLAEVRLDRARYLVAVAGSDTSNLAITLAAASVAERRSRGPLPIVLHVSESGMADVLRGWRARGTQERNVRIQFFNTADGGSRSLLDRLSPFDGADEAPRLLIVGLSETGENLVLHAARVAATGQDDGRRARLVLVDAEASGRLQALCDRYPRLTEICEVETVDLDPCSTAFKAGALRKDEAARQATHAYITLDDEAQALRAGLDLMRCLPDIPVVVMVRDRESEDTLVQGLSDGHPDTNGLCPFAVLERALSPELLLLDENELIARAQHEEYVRKELESGATTETNPSLVGWEELPEAVQESGRRAADAISSRLARDGFALTADPLVTARTGELQLPDSTLEELAALEHERWRADLLADGWTRGPRKDAERKIHPMLVPWDELPAQERERNLQTIRALPAVLARAGFSYLPNEPQGSR